MKARRSFHLSWTNVSCVPGAHRAPSARALHSRSRSALSAARRFRGCDVQRRREAREARGRPPPPRPRQRGSATPVAPPCARGLGRRPASPARPTEPLPEITRPRGPPPTALPGPARRLRTPVHRENLPGRVGETPGLFMFGFRCPPPGSATLGADVTSRRVRPGTDA